MATRPYSALLQSLAVDLAPQAKRRKVETTTQNSVVETRERDPLASTTGDDVDEVEEAEEGPETATEGLLEEDDPDTEDSSDPFVVHFADPDENVLSKRLKALQKNQWTTQKYSVSKIGKAIAGIPDDIQAKDSAMPVAIPGPASLKLKQKLAGSFMKQNPTFDSLEQAIVPCLFDYHDLLFCERTPSNSERLRRLTCLHAINHVFKYVSG
jgi:U3 small nucleolar RNA-associated protein 25